MTQPPNSNAALLIVTLPEMLAQLYPYLELLLACAH
ncbi:Uncharacterised protein [Vibrio furnissii]|nr:Uncharacterised protein [Vibrio furnissii]